MELGQALAGNTERCGAFDLSQGWEQIEAREVSELC